MALHRELFNDLPPAEKLLAGYARAFEEWNNADGYYDIVQQIAGQYGEKAYELAEEVFREMGMDWDPVLLRTPESVRRIGYNNEGINVYNVQVSRFAPEMTREVIRLYNEQIRKVSYDALMDESYFKKCIQGAGRLLVALNENDQPVGFIHCLVENHLGTVDMLIFSHGRIYNPVRKALVNAAAEFFKGQNVKEVKLLSGKVPYPFYCAVANDREAKMEAGLPHVAAALSDLQSLRDL